MQSLNIWSLNTIVKLLLIFVSLLKNWLHLLQKFIPMHWIRIRNLWNNNDFIGFNTTNSAGLRKIQKLYSFRNTRRKRVSELSILKLNMFLSPSFPFNHLLYSSLSLFYRYPLLLRVPHARLVGIFDRKATESASRKRTSLAASSLLPLVSSSVSFYPFESHHDFSFWLKKDFKSL